MLVNSELTDETTEEMTESPAELICDWTDCTMEEIWALATALRPTTKMVEKRIMVMSVGYCEVERLTD